MIVYEVSIAASLVSLFVLVGVGGDGDVQVHSVECLSVFLGPQMAEM